VQTRGGIAGGAGQLFDRYTFAETNSTGKPHSLRTLIYYQDTFAAHSSFSAAFASFDLFDSGIPHDENHALQHKRYANEEIDPSDRLTVY
jgi:hypothetical protein